MYLFKFIQKEVSPLHLIYITRNNYNNTAFISYEPPLKCPFDTFLTNKEIRNGAP